jgi:tRNA(Ile)-lysidine synthase
MPPRVFISHSSSFVYCHILPGNMATNGKREPFPWMGSVREALAVYPRDQRYLIGVSGGLDSRVLLELLLDFGFSNLVICHLNHNLRGSASREDAEFVERLAKRLKLPCFSKTIKAWPRNRSIETASRLARHRLFAEAAEEFKTNRVFLAHQADDLVETFLFNILRGTGSLGNAAIESETTIQVDKQSLLIARPLLSVWKVELHDFAKRNHLRFREDATNAESRYTRNRIRNLLIPEIENILGRSVKRNLFRLSQVTREEEKLLEEVTPRIWERETISVSEIGSLPVALQRRVIYRWLNWLDIPDLGFEEIEAVRALVAHEKPAKTNLPRDRFCRRKAGQLFIDQKTERMAAKERKDHKENDG